MALMKIVMMILIAIKRTKISILLLKF